MYGLTAWLARRRSRVSSLCKLGVFSWLLASADAIFFILFTISVLQTSDGAQLRAEENEETWKTTDTPGHSQPHQDEKKAKAMDGGVNDSRY